MTTWLSIGIALIGVQVALNEARWTRARKQGHKLIFQHGYIARASYFLATAVCVIGGIFSTDDHVVTIVLFGFALAFLTTWPRTIALDDSQIMEIGWGGLYRKHALWEDVTSAIRLESESEREVLIGLRNGKMIKHTEFHIDRDRFISEVGKHIKVLGGPPREL